MSDLGETVLRWQRGWSVSRGLPDGEDAGGGTRVRCEQRGRDVEYFAHDDAPDVIGALAEKVLAEPAVTWLTVPTHAPGPTARALTGAGLVVLRSGEALMETDLRTQPRSTPKAPYALALTGDTSLTVTVTHPDCETAARGSAGLAGRDAIADRIGTDPAHRRRGLGSVVMSALADAALERGADRGLLIASEDGQRLYTALGWRTLATVLVAARPGTVYPF
ncbi:GNAT family N-acetyltransferase [Catenuloplanes japonicus]|uniref:GNAT family N-acetyltransferase n=1 Tax=Catenuloplanes japonicus TaxID=33876 RepID=UPI00052410DE|nr:GNAT family N-acetyltransferase [Catenuloplanes japonicus]